MEWATNLITEIYKYLDNRDDFGIDRLNRLYTVALLSAFVTLISTQQYIVGGKILCWTPQDFSDARNTYAHNICWLGEKNYYVSENTTTLPSPSHSREYPFTIYPWLPIVLLVMIVCFVFPYALLWRGLSTRSGLNIKRLMKISDSDQLCSAIHSVFIEEYKTKKRIYVFCVYFLMKILYIGILCGQLLLVKKVLFGHYFPLNISEIFTILSVKYNMWSSAHLPIETMCDFMIRVLGQNNNWHTVQCLLPFNLFTKRIFALLFLWFILLLILNLLDLLSKWKMRSNSSRSKYVDSLFDLFQKYLYTENDQIILRALENRQWRSEFIFKYLGVDGYLLLQFLHTKHSDMDMSYLVVKLFHRFSQEEREEFQQPGHIEV